MDRISRSISFLFLLSLLSACVTINISFPPAAAEKAADKIIDEVWQLKDGNKQPVPAPTQPQ